MLLTYTAAFAAADGGKCSGDESFTRSWRTVEKYTSRWGYAHLLEHVGVQEWEKGHFFELRDVCSNLEQVQKKCALDYSRSSSPPTSSNEIFVFTPSGSASARART